MMRRYPAYRDSGVEWLGEVPDGWEVSPSRRLFRQVREPSLAADEQLSATQKSGVLPQRLFIEQEDQKVVLALSGLENFKHVEVGDFVISLRSFQGGIEYSAYVGCVSPAYTVLRPTKNIGAGFFRYLLKCDPYIGKLQSVTSGIRDGRNVSYEQFGVVSLPLPPLPEQTAIAAFLDRETAKIDALVAEQRRLIDLLREKRQAVISHAVTKGLNPAAPMKPSGVDWLGDVPEGWEVGPLKRFWSVTDCKHLTADFVDEGFPLASIREVQSYFVDLTDAKRTTEEFYTQLIEGGREPKPGDLIFSRNATVGEVSQVTAYHPLFAMGQDVCLLRRHDEKHSPDFLQAFLGSSSASTQLELLMIGATFKRVNVDAIRNLVVTCPPSAEQDAIASHIRATASDFEALVATSEDAIALLQERRAALISAAVTGKIDVRDLVSVETEAA